MRDYHDVHVFPHQNVGARFGVGDWLNGPMTTNGHPLRVIATGQRGNFSRRQANAGGVSNAMLRSRTQSGHLEQVGPHAFTGANIPKDALTKLHALMLDIGDPVWACGPTAAALSHFDGYTLKAPFHLLTLRDRNVRRIGHVIHSSRNLPLIDRARVDDIAVTSPTRTVIDLVRFDPAGPITAAVDSAIRDLGTSEDFLHRRITALRRSGRTGIPRLLALIEGCEAARGGQSWLERRFLEILAANGLPKPETQVVMSKARDKLIRVDCLFAGHELVVEVLGYRWHRTALQMTRDAERMNQLASDGKRMIQFSYSHVVNEPIYIVSTLAEFGITATPT